MTRVFTTEFVSGLFVMLMGAVALYAIGDLDIGEARDMGPGYLPRLLAWLIILAGVGMTLVALWRGEEPLPEMFIRPLFTLSLATFVFALCIDRLGMVIAVVASTAIASLASPITRHRETPILCLVLAVGAVLMFITGLKLPIPIWPR